MEATLPVAPAAAPWAGRVLTALPTVFLAFDTLIKVAGESHAVEGTVGLGFSPSLVVPLGLLELACLALYLVPRTAVLGAVLLTGWLGGAVAVHVQLGNPLLTHALFPVYVGGLLWAGLYLRDPRVRTLV